MYIDKLDDIVYICSNRYHSTIKMKPVHANSSSYNHFAIENNNKKPNSKVDDDIRILGYKKAKCYVPNRLEKIFMNKEFQILARGNMLLDINGEKILERFSKKNLKKQIAMNLEIKK